MAATKVLIVDDSLTMRALFTSALETSRDLVVVGAANGADQAREMIRDLKPDVLTLDVEMPGKNGIEFLGELMETHPMPVVMLSTLTQKGADVSFKAMEIGAVDCFPKPQKATPDEFDKIAGKLCKVVATAAKTNIHARKHRAHAPRPAIASYQWDGSLIAVSAGMGGIEALGQMLAHFPENSPPIIVVMEMDEGLVAPFAAKLGGAIAPKVVVGANCTVIEPGHVYICCDASRHFAIDGWPGGRIRTVQRDPVNGHRPSADILFSTMAKSAGAQSDGVILSGGGADGAAGLAMMRQAGARTFCQDEASSLIYEACAAAVAKGGVQHQLDPAHMAAQILGGAERRVAA